MENTPILVRFPLLRELDRERREEFEDYFRTAPAWLLDACSLQEVEKQTTLIRAGDPADTVFFAVDGIIRSAGCPIYGVGYDCRFFCRMCAFGGMEVFLRLDRYQTTLQAQTHCTFLRIPSQDFRRWMDSDLVALRRESQHVGEYLLDMVEETRTLLFLQGADRVALLLVNRYRKCARDGVLQISRDREDLSDFTGLCRKSISRSLKKFREEGMLTIQGNHILVNREQYLRLQARVSQVSTTAP